MRLSAEEVRVPDAEQTSEGGDVVFQRRFLEMLVHGVCPRQELVEVVEADVQADAQADGAPDAVAAADPVLEAEHVPLVDAELGHLGLVGRQRHEVLGDVLLVPGRLEEPGLGRVGVRRRLRRREGLGRDQKQRRLGVGVAEGLGDVGAIDVGDEVHLQIPVAVRLERLANHHGTPAKARSQLSVPARGGPRPSVRLSDRSSSCTYRSEPPMPMLMMVSILFPE